MPVLRTKTMPARAARAGTRGRPPLGLGGSLGRNGSMASQRSSGTRAWCFMGRMMPRPPGIETSSKGFRRAFEEFAAAAGQVPEVVARAAVEQDVAGVRADAGHPEVESSRIGVDDDH